MATHPFVHRSALVQTGYLLQPLDECPDQRAEHLLRLPVIQLALFIALNRALMPANHKLVRKHALIVECFHERIQELLLRWVSLHKVKHNRLHQPFDAHLAVVLNKLEESWLILGPEFNAVAFPLEEAAEEDVVLVLRSDVHDQLHLPDLGQKVLDGALTLGHVRVDLGNEVVYTMLAGD